MFAPHFWLLLPLASLRVINCCIGSDSAVFLCQGDGIFSEVPDSSLGRQECPVWNRGTISQVSPHLKQLCYFFSFFPILYAVVDKILLREKSLTLKKTFRNNGNGRYF